ncbi:MAG: hypothetical protein Q9207_004432 [Kuettlingeria erythrocarpa]
MTTYRIVQILLTFLLCWTAFAGAGTLGISQDETGAGYFHWSSVAIYDDDTSKLFDDKGLAAVAKAAYEELVADLDRDRDEPLAPVHKPYNIAAMAAGDEIWFSSTLKGGAFIYTSRARNTIDENVAEEVSLALQRCQIESHSRAGHRTGAACGEPLCAQQYCSTYKDRRLADQNARMITWGKYSEDAAEDDVGIVDPCDGGPGDWGCKTWLPKINVRGIRDFLNGEDPGKPPKDPSSTRKACFWDPSSTT